MDAVAEAKTGLEKSLKGWATDGETLMKAAQAAGVDIPETLKGTRVVATITGTFAPGERPRITGRRRSSRRRRGGASNGAVTGEQLQTFLQEHPEGVSQSQLASHFGVSRTTISRKLAEADNVYAEGEGSQKRWHVRELQPA